MTMDYADLLAKFGGNAVLIVVAVAGLVAGLAAAYTRACPERTAAQVLIFVYALAQILTFVVGAALGSFESGATLTLLAQFVVLGLIAAASATGLQKAVTDAESKRQEAYADRDARQAVAYAQLAADPLPDPDPAPSAGLPDRLPSEP